MASTFTISDVVTFLGPQLTILVSVVLLLIIVMIILAISQKRIKGKLRAKETQEKEEYSLMKKIEQLKRSSRPGEEILNSLDRLARNYLMEVYRFRKSIEYSDMIHFFKGKNKERIVKFCQKMLKGLYAGQEIQKTDLNSLLVDFETIAKNEKPILRVKDEDKKYIVPPKNQEEYDIMVKLESVNKQSIGKAYEELQKLFSKTYKKAIDERNKADLKKIKNYRGKIIKKVNNYLKNNSNIEELAHEIKRSSQLLSFLLNSEQEKEKEQILLEEDKD